MGPFSLVWVSCPYCKEDNSEEFRPKHAELLSFPQDCLKMPINYLERLDEMQWFCDNCHKEFKTTVDKRFFNKKR